MRRNRQLVGGLQLFCKLMTHESRNSRMPWYGQFAFRTAVQHMLSAVPQGPSILSHLLSNRLLHRAGFNAHRLFLVLAESFCTSQCSTATPFDLFSEGPNSNKKLTRFKQSWFAPLYLKFIVTVYSFHQTSPFTVFLTPIAFWRPTQKKVG